MTRTLTLILTGFLLLAAQSKTQQSLLILCTADQCDFRRVLSFTIGGKAAVRPIPTVSTITPDAAKQYAEVPLDQAAGLYRNPATGVVYTLGADGNPSVIAVPTKLSGKQAVSPAALWQGQLLNYYDATAPKTKAVGALDRVAYFVVAADIEAAAFGLLQRWLDEAQPDPRRLALIKGGLQFGAGPYGTRWREAIATRMRGDLKRFESQDGDPTTLALSLSNAVQLRATYMQMGGAQQEQPLLDRIAATDDLFRRRLAIAAALRNAKLWDEYLVKLDQLGMARWTMPDILPNIREALGETTKVHQQQFKKLAAERRWDRAFDEAETAARSSCQKSVLDDFYGARIEFVNHNKIAAAPEYTGEFKLSLEQIVRELEVLDPTKEQLILERIQQGESRDPNYLPLQWKRAEFLDKLGRYSEALDVVRRIERRIRLDAKQLDQALGLDGRIGNNLAAAIQKALEETRKHYSERTFPQAIEAANKGLTADPTHPSLLFHAAMSSAFLRKRDESIKYIQTYFKRANLTCAEAGQPETLLSLYRLLAGASSAPKASDGVPNWISGARYQSGQAFYDPISLGFQQPITRIISGDGSITQFTREDRSYLVRSVSTGRSDVTRPNALGPVANWVETFLVEPRYDRKALTMLEIGSKATSAGERTMHSLTYSNSPTIDTELVLRFTGARVARGWAGNPFFHPFIWVGLYVFDLTYDDLGRVKTATPVPDAAGLRPEPFSEPLEFTWDGSSLRLLSIQGKSGYSRVLNYDRRGLLRSETISFGKKRGLIEYEYLPDSALILRARSVDDFYDFRERSALFDLTIAQEPAPAYRQSPEPRKAAQ